MKKRVDKKYFGVWYARSPKTGLWFCDLIISSFDTEKKIKNYIKGWYENGPAKLPSQY